LALNQANEWICFIANFWSSKSTSTQCDLKTLLCFRCISVELSQLKDWDCDEMSPLFHTNWLSSAFLYRQMMKAQRMFLALKIVLIHWFVFVCFIHHVQSNVVNVSLLILHDAHQFWKRISWPNDRKHLTRVVFYFMFGIHRKIELILSFDFRFFLHLNTIVTLYLSIKFLNASFDLKLIVSLPLKLFKI
jgi:hypothetical protein